MSYQLHEILELREQRFALGEQIRAMYRGKGNEKRTPSAEEEARVDAMIADSEALKARIERMERADGLLKDVTKPGGRSAGAADPDPDAGDPAENGGEGGAPADAELLTLTRALSALAGTLQQKSSRDLRNVGKGVRDTPEYRKVWGEYLMGDADRNELARRARELRVEHRDLQVDSELQAGALVPPQLFVAELLKDLDDETFLRSWARGFTVANAKSLGAPKRTGKASTWTWGAELATPTVDTSLKFGARELHPRHASGEIKVSRPWLRSALLDGETIVRDEIARDGAEFLEKAMLTGTGAGEPLGVFTASGDGISTSRDVATGNAATEVTLTGLREAKYSIKAPYWPSLRWLGSRTFHKQCYSMDDADGRPLLVESLKTGELDRVLSFPIFISEFAPSTFTTGKYVAILGDWFRGYWYADGLDMELQRLDELYARSNQVGFIARLQTDGMPVLEECWARVKLG